MGKRLSFLSEGMKMKVLSFKGGCFGANTYIVMDDKEENALVIDPSAKPAEVLPTLTKKTVLRGIVLTHGHFDHIEALAEWKALSLPLCLAEKDEELLSSPAKNGSLFFGFSLSFPFKADRLLKDGETLTVGNEALTVMHTPGHTKGSIVLWGEDFVITGDTVFADGGYGRYDLYGGEKAALADSLSRFFSRQGEYRIYAGHGREGRYTQEKQYRRM